MSNMTSKDTINNIMVDYPPLTFDEERDMINNYMAKNDRAGLNERLILHNVGMIYRSAKGWLKIYEEDDFYSFGLEALRIAAEKFDISRNIKFATFAAFPIKTTMRNHINDYFNNVTLNSISIDAPINSSKSDNDESVIGDIITTSVKDEFSPKNFIDEIDSRHNISHLMRFFKSIRLTKKEIDCLFRVYVNSETIMSISNKYGCSRTRIQQIINKAMYKIRNYFKNKAKYSYGIALTENTYSSNSFKCNSMHNSWKDIARRVICDIQ